MKNKISVEFIRCPFCDESRSIPWAQENGYTAVKCESCGLVYVNPRPAPQLIDEGVRTGVHRDVDHGRTAINRRARSKVRKYRKILGYMFEDVWQRQQRISWLDIGAGYGELMQALIYLAEAGSKIEGLEPMEPKAVRARERGLNIREGYVSNITEKYDYVSLINVFSHIPDFKRFLCDTKNVLKENGEIIIETGNIGDLESYRKVLSELDLPDHLVFAGERHIIGYLTEAGFEIIKMDKMRKDGVLQCAKQIARLCMGRGNHIAYPWTSNYRSLLVRAKMLP